MLLLSDLSYRMKDNARTFFLVAMVSTVSFCAIGTLYGLQPLLNRADGASDSYPIVYVSEKGDTQQQANVQRVEQSLQGKGIAYQQVHLTLNRYKLQTDSNERTILSASMFNQASALLKQKPVQLQGNDTLIAIISDSRMDTANQLKQKDIVTANGITLKPTQILISPAVPNDTLALIVSDEQYARLGKPAEVTQTYMWQTDASHKVFITAAKQIMGNNVGLEVTDHSVLEIPTYSLYIVQSLYGLALFIGLFIGIVFFVSAGSFLYFRLYSDLDEDKQKFRAIAKLGLTNRELNQVLTRQIALLFFAPIVVALVHGSIALATVARLFNAQMATQFVIVLSIFSLIQIVYFFVVRFFYIKQVREALH